MVYPAGHEYRVTAATVIRVELPSDQPRSEEELLLWAGPVTAMVMWGTGIFPLHAVGLELPGATVAIAAAPGGGKSTLASLALRHRIPVSGDDLLGVTPEGQLVPRRGSLRIEREMAPGELRASWTLSDGRGWYPLPERPGAPLGALVLLERGASPRLSPVEGHLRVARLLSAGFLSRYDARVPPGWEARLLEFTARLPTWRLAVPQGVERLRAAWPEIRGLLALSLAKDR